MRNSGHPLSLILTDGQVHDVTVAAELISDLKSETVLADTAYDSNKFREQIKSRLSIKKNTKSGIKLSAFSRKSDSYTL